jgi:hypothetical protein
VDLVEEFRFRVDDRHAEPSGIAFQSGFVMGKPASRALSQTQAAVPGGLPATRQLIWCDPVNICESLGLFLFLSFRGQGQQQPWQV